MNGFVEGTGWALNQYTAVGGAAPVYDGNGNLTSDGTLTYAYDAESRLSSIKQGATTLASYAYDAQSRRTSKTVGSTTTLFVTDADNREVLEYDGTSGAVQRWYSQGPGLNAALNQMNVAAGTRTTLIPDIQGSVIATLDSGSGAVTKAAYLPYGENPTTTTGTFRYAGARIDPETGGTASQLSGLYYMRARMYSPTWGRFLQPDPIGYAGGENLYAYVGNDPLDLTDPGGDYANVVVNGNHVTILLPIQFTGSGLTSARQAAITTAIQGSWTGQFGQYDVMTIVTTPTGNTPPSQMNIMTVLDQPGVSVTNAAGGNQTTIYTTYPGYPTYTSGQLGEVGAHEAGHLMGDVDYYSNQVVNGVMTSTAMPGYENDLMANINGSVDQRNINAILNCASTSCYPPAGSNPANSPTGPTNITTTPQSASSSLSK